MTRSQQLPSYFVQDEQGRRLKVTVVRDVIVVQPIHGPSETTITVTHSLPDGSLIAFAPDGSMTNRETGEKLKRVH